MKLLQVTLLALGILRWLLVMDPCLNWVQVPDPALLCEITAVISAAKTCKHLSPRIHALAEFLRS
jgi:hypothetical protein